MINEEFVKSIASEVRAGLFEGGAGSGNWGHKGRPGHRGGSLGGGKGKGGSISVHKAGGGGKGAKTTGKGWGALPKARAMTSNEKKFWGKFRKEREGGGISAHIVRGSGAVSNHIEKNFPKKEWERKSLVGSPKGGYQTMTNKKTGESVRVDWTHKGGKTAEIRVTKGAGGGGKTGGISAHKISVGGEKIHAREFYNAQGKLDTVNYGKLSGANKTQVLKHGIQKYNEAYMPKAHQGKLDANGLSANKKIGALEGMRRAAVTKAKSSTGKESRAAMHVAISLQARANAVFSQIKASGSKTAGSAVGTGSKVIGAGLATVKTAARPVGR